MAVRYNLGPGEYEILRASGVAHRGGGVIDYDELLLTNHNIIWTDKGKWGSVKTILAYPLKDIQIMKRKARVFNGGRVGDQFELVIHFRDGKETFGFSNAEEVNEWVRQISAIVTGVDPEDVEVDVPEEVTSFKTEAKESNTVKNVAGTVIGAYTSILNGEDPTKVILSSINSLNKRNEADRNSNTEKQYAEVKTNSRNASNGKPKGEMVAAKCSGCHAPLSGTKGQIVKCKYCDTLQKL